MGRYFISPDGIVSTHNAQLVLERLLDDGRTMRYFLCLDCHDILDVASDDCQFGHACDGGQRERRKVEAAD
jgi:hypothetical protein